MPNGTKNEWPTQVINFIESSREYKSGNHRITATGNMKWNWVDLVYSKPEWHINI